MLWVHYAFYTCYSIYFLKLIIYISVNAKRLGRNKNDMFWYFILKPQNSLKTLPFMNETYHLNISTFMEHNMLSLANVFNLFLIPFHIVWFRTTHHMAPITKGILDIVLKDCAHWAEFLIPLTGTSFIPSLACWPFTCPAYETLLQSHGRVNTRGWTGAQLHTGEKRGMRYKIHWVGWDVAIPYSVKIWTILEENIKNTVC